MFNCILSKGLIFQLLLYVKQECFMHSIAFIFAIYFVFKESVYLFLKKIIHFIQCLTCILSHVLILQLYSCVKCEKFMHSMAVSRLPLSNLFFLL